MGEGGDVRDAALDGVDAVRGAEVAAESGVAGGFVVSFVRVS